MFTKLKDAIGFWLLQNALSFDQWVNAFFFFGYADETLSARAWRRRYKRLFWMAMFLLIEMLFFWQDNHCQDAYESERLRKQLPRGYS